MKRTDLTAKIIAKEIGFTGEIGIETDLRERMVSDMYEGKLWEDVRKEYGEKFGKVPESISMYLLAAMGGAESDTDFEVRTCTAMKRIRETYAGKRVLIVGHGNVFRSVFAWATGFDREDVMTQKQYRLSNCERVRLPQTQFSNPLDRWMISELEVLTAKMINNYDRYDLQSIARDLLHFMDNLTNWYVRRSRRRFWKSENDSDK